MIQTITSYDDNCIYCAALATYGDVGKTQSFMRNLGDILNSRTVLQTLHFSLIASIGSLVEGSLTIVLKEHQPSMSHMPANYFGELEHILHKTSTMLKTAYTIPLFFEHGPMPICEASSQKTITEGGGSCIDHAHIHAVPISADVKNIMKACFYHYKINDLLELRKRAEENRPYIYLEDQEGQRFIFEAENAPRQCVRRVISTVLGRPETWDWRANENWPMAYKTLLRLKCTEGEKK